MEKETICFYWSLNSFDVFRKDIIIIRKDIAAIYKSEILSHLLQVGALSQIDDMRYDSEMRHTGIKDILRLGIAFSDKNVSVKTKQM